MLMLQISSTSMTRPWTKHAPRRKIVLRKVPDCPWFDGVCATSKKLTRRLERHFKNSPSDEREHCWRTQAKLQRRLFQQKRCNYLRDNIECATVNCRALWKSLNTLLTPPPDTSLRISPDTLLDYFENKVKAIQESTKDPPVPDFSTLPPSVHSLCKFDEDTTAEVERLLNDSSTKQCELDSAPVWLLKSLCMVFAPILALLINVSIVQGVSPRKTQACHHSTSSKETRTGPDRSDQLSSYFKLVLHFETC